MADAGDMDNRVYRERIRYPAAWTTSETVDKKGISRKLTSDQIDTMWALVEQTRDRAVEDLAPADFANPLIDRLMSEVHRELVQGKGVVLLSGLDISALSLEDFGRFYWGLGTHLGHAAINNSRGDRLCRVQHETDERVPGFGYRRNIELRAHSDYHEVLGLAAFQRAEQGGRTGLVSSLALHNVLLEEKPEHLKALYEGYFHVAPGTDQVLPRKAPMFCNINGTVSLAFHFRHYEEAAARLGQELPPELIAAWDFVQEVASRPELNFNFLLEPGEILFWHNFTLLHSRTAFTDSKDHKRLLLRLFLHVPQGRPMHHTFNERARSFDRMHERAMAKISTQTGSAV